jgi:hypothetical protein
MSDQAIAILKSWKMSGGMAWLSKLKLLHELEILNIVAFNVKDV